MPWHTPFWRVARHPTDYDTVRLPHPRGPLRQCDLVAMTWREGRGDMVWLILGHLVAFLVDLAVGGRCLTSSEKSGR